MRHMRPVLRAIQVCFVFAAQAFSCAYAAGDTGKGTITWINATRFPYTVERTSARGCLISGGDTSFTVPARTADDVGRHSYEIELPTDDSCQFTKFYISWKVTQTFRHGRTVVGNVAYEEYFTGSTTVASASLDYFAGTQDMTFRVACGDDDKYCPNDETDTVGVRVTKVVILPVVDADLLRLRGRELFGGT